MPLLAAVCCFRLATLAFSAGLSLPLLGNKAAITCRVSPFAAAFSHIPIKPL
jgi:hypothetical protein